MNSLVARVRRAILRVGQTISIEQASVVAVLKKLMPSEVLVYETSGTAAYWDRPVWLIICPPETVISSGDDVVTADFEGLIRKVIPMRFQNTLVSKLAIMTQKPSPNGQPDPNQPTVP